MTHTDSYANIRTNVVTFWALTNGALVAAILSTDASANIATSGSSAKVNIYMAFLLYSCVSNSRRREPTHAALPPSLRYGSAARPSTS